jgi:hypothetical protein
VGRRGVLRVHVAGRCRRNELALLVEVFRRRGKRGGSRGLRRLFPCGRGGLLGLSAVLPDGGRVLACRRRWARGESLAPRLFFLSERGGHLALRALALAAGAAGFDLLDGSIHTSRSERAIEGILEVHALCIELKADPLDDEALFVELGNERLEGGTPRLELALPLVRDAALEVESLRQLLDQAPVAFEEFFTFGDDRLPSALVHPLASCPLVLESLQGREAGVDRDQPGGESSKETKHEYGHGELPFPGGKVPSMNKGPLVRNRCRSAKIDLRHVDFQSHVVRNRCRFGEIDLRRVDFQGHVVGNRCRSGAIDRHRVDFCSRERREGWARGRHNRQR